MDTLISSLIEYGMAGIFLAFMVWTYISNTKRMDGQLEKFIEKIESLRKAHSEEQNLIRTRYDTVIAAYNKEKDEATAKIKEQMHEILRDLQQMESHFNTLSIQTESSNESLRGMRLELQELAGNLRDLSTRAEKIYVQVESSSKSIQSISDQHKMEQAAKLAIAQTTDGGSQQ